MIADFRIEVLSLASEDEYLLCEVLGRATAMEPTLSRARAREVAHEAVADLHRRGLVMLKRVVGASTKLASEGDAFDVLAEESSWDPPATWAEGIMVVATGRGQQFYMEGRPLPQR